MIEAMELLEQHFKISLLLANLFAQIFDWPLHPAENKPAKISHLAWNTLKGFILVSNQ